MASIFRPQKSADLRSGGKIVRARRVAAPRTPYDRPSHPLPDSSPQNPNWLSKLILSPTRIIATGAGKLLSAFRSDSSSSSSDGDYTSEGESDYADDDIGVSSQDANQLVKFDSLGNDPQAIEWKSETKRVIERLLMQETFSREECDRLTYIIKSRVVDTPVIGGIDGRLSDIRNRAFGSDVDMSDHCSAAVTEAKKWLDVKKLGSNSKPQLEYGTCTLNSALSPHVIEGEIGSPVDLAKSYMRERPPWASPSTNNIQLKSPPLIGTQLFKEDAPYLYSSTSKLIADSPSTGSWNITEEIRKVRSKATEDMLRRRPLLITDFSMSASDSKRRSPRLLVADKAESVPQMPQDRLLIQASPPDPASSTSQQTQDLITIRITEDVEALPDSSEGGLNHSGRLQPSENRKAESQNGSTAAAAAADGTKDPGGSGQPLNSTVGGDTQDSKSHEINFSTLVEVTVVDGAVATNGFPSPGSSLHAGQEGEEKSKLPSEHNNGLVDSGHDNENTNNNKNTSALIDETHELLTESNMELPIDNDNNVEATVSQTSSSMQHEEVLQEEEEEEQILPPNTKRKAGKNNEHDVATVTEKQQQGGRRRYVRKGKGRIK